jgi:hypothetical protein
MLPTQTIFRFLGMSGATKPTTAPDGSALPAGSSFDEEDTGNRWRWDGSFWKFQGQVDLKQQDIVQAINAGFQALQQQLAAEMRALKATIASSGFVDTQDPSQGQ